MNTYDNLLLIKMDIINIITLECDRLSNKINNFYKLKKELDELIQVKNVNILDNIQYMSKIINYNKGELGEICVVQQLYNLPIDTLINLFGGDADQGIQLLNMELKIPVTNINLIKKAPSASKADCLIKLNKTNELIYISIKCQNGSPPTILNHTPRSANVFSNDLKDELNLLDIIIDKLNQKRINNEVGEDIQIKNINLSEDEKTCIINTVTYFTFDGSGKCKSKYPCNGVLEVKNVTKPDTWKFIKCNLIEDKKMYVQSIYDRLIISLRDKGMPKNIPESCIPWIFESNIKKKGSLHIRLKK